MRIVHVARNLHTVGGVPEYVFGLGAASQRAGHEVRVLASGRPGRDWAPPGGAGDVDTWWHDERRGPRNVRIARGLGRSIARSSRWGDVFHVHQASFSGSWLALGTPKPTVATLYQHPGGLPEPGSRRHLQMRVFLRAAAGIVAVSQSELDLISGVRPPRRSIVVWPALTGDAAPVDRDHHTTTPLVLAISRLARTKGIDLLLRTFAELRGEAETVLVGMGKHSAEFELTCQELGLDREEVLFGAVSDETRDALLERASVFISASAEESFGIAPLRAIASGCWPVLTAIPSHLEILRTIGLPTEHTFSPKAEPHEVAQLVRNALHECRSIGEDVLSRIPTWDRVVDTYLEFLEEVTGR